MQGLYKKWISWIPTGPRHYCLNLLPPEQPSSLIGDERQRPSQQSHINPLENRPLPGIRFPPNYGHGADALQREDIKNHQSDRYERGVNRRAVGMLLVLQGFGEARRGRGALIIFTDVINC